MASSTVLPLIHSVARLLEGGLSRRHAEVRPVGTGYAVADLGSTNGTRVNGIRIQGGQIQVG